ncbi:glycosyltransferase [Portibacter lacus]|uniref:Glycosyl transferase n=1 Tax=Portibacter lacus TaxID=1099794 RepID=A0AA37SLF2_9BACT|nr:glycosyltransferase [Portibacter lacus]GLR16336.1 glycosyl transferase [Portibacter lacus]
MKKITICITNDYVYDRRIQRCVETLKTHYDIEIICRNLHGENTDYPDIKVTRIRMLFNQGFLFYAFFNLRVFLMLLLRKIDIVVAVDYDTIIAAQLSSRFRGTKLVFDAHEFYEESIEIVHRKNVQKFWKWVGKKFVRKADSAYTVSGTIAQTYSEMHGIPFQTVRNVPYFHELSKIRNPHSKKVILYQGVINQGRKLDLLVDSAKYLPEDYEVWIIGEGDLSQVLREQSGENVVFHSWVHPDELYRLTEKATLAYNLLDDSSRSYYYSLANKFFDYIQAGIPSLNNSFPEYVKINERYNCCIITDVNNAQELAQNIMNLVENKQLLSEKRKNARIAAKDLCWENESKTLLKIFNSL